VGFSGERDKCFVSHGTMNVSYLASVVQSMANQSSTLVPNVVNAINALYGTGCNQGAGQIGFSGNATYAPNSSLPGSLSDVELWYFWIASQHDLCSNWSNSLHSLSASNLRLDNLHYLPK